MIVFKKTKTFQDSGDGEKSLKKMKRVEMETRTP